MKYLEPAEAHPSSTSIAIGCFGAICRDWVGDRLIAFARVQPDVGIGIQDMAVSELVSSVRSGALAMAIIPGDPPFGLASTRLWSDRVSVATASEHRLAARGYVTLEELRQQRLLIRGDGGHHALDRFLLGRLLDGRARAEMAVVSVPSASLIDWIADDRGIGLRCEHDGERDPRIAVVAVDSPAAHFDVHACWNTGRVDRTIATLLRAFGVTCT